HAAGTSTAAAELAAVDLQHLDAQAAQVVVGDGVAGVGDDDAGLEGQQVAAVVPLLPGGGPRVLVGGDDAQLRQTERAGDDLVHVRGRVPGDDQLELPVHLVPGGEGPRRQVRQAEVAGEGLLVDHRHRGVQVHHSPGLGHVQGDD